MKPPYPEEVKQEAVRLYLEEDMTRREVAAALGCSDVSVINWVKEAGEDVRQSAPRPVEPLKRFWEKVDMSGDCWEWTAGTDRDGYGKFWDGKATVRAIRFIYEWAYGENPGDLFVCHSCDNPACVRPDHLWLGTAHDNNMDFIVKGRYNEDSWRFPNFVGGLNG